MNCSHCGAAIRGGIEEARRLDGARLEDFQVLSLHLVRPGQTSTSTPALYHRQCAALAREAKRTGGR